MKTSRTFAESFFINWNKIRAKAFTTLLASSFFSIGNKTTIIPPFRFSNLSQIQLGSRVTIHQNCWIHVLNSATSCKSAINGPKLIMKDHVEIGMNATISAAKLIVIEENVFTAPNVYISDHGHEYRDVNVPIAMQGIRKVAEVRIGENTWLGQNVVILPGVTIGKHCVVGANSVVNRNVPDYCIAAGAPAKVRLLYNRETACWERVNIID
jgi:acetyltransferase-like isoleucine patch superfamily enzyme